MVPSPQETLFARDKTNPMRDLYIAYQTLHGSIRVSQKEIAIWIRSHLAVL